MFRFLHALAIFVANLFKSRRRLETENIWLRHQLNVALRGSERLRIGIDRALWVWLARLGPDLLGSIQVVKPETCCAGIERVFEPTGAGSRGSGDGAPRSMMNCGN